MAAQDLGHEDSLHAFALDDGTVEVRVDVPGPIEDVWAALTSPAGLASWFGTLEAPMREGQRTRFSFGDGDFFDVQVVELLEPLRVAFDWTFLGLGSPHRVVWTVVETDAGAQVTVVDHDPGRRPAECAEMVGGWSDFMLRLRRYLVTGEQSRYDWRGDIDGAIDLTGPSQHPLDEEAVIRWLPVATDGHRPAWFFVIDSEGPRRFPVRDWHLDRDRGLTFEVTLDEDAGATRCSVVAEPIDGGLRLRFRHAGWHETGMDERSVRQLRRRFADAWREALQMAGEASGARTG